LPLAHIFERVILAACLHTGNTIGFYSGDIRMLTDDLQALKPTLFAGVPRVFDKFHETIVAKVESSTIKKAIFKKAFRDRQKSMKQGRNTGGIYDNVAFKKAKKKFGGRIRLVLSGGAPLSPRINEFVSILFGCPVVQGYGLTETCGAVCMSNPQDKTFSQVGPPLSCCEVKLVSVPDLDYKVEDNKGEICVRGYNISSGYFKDEEKTKEDFDEEGWFHTGDIGHWNDSGTLSIIDRKKNIFKLSQGEYIQAEVLEGLYKNKYISQLWIHGYSTEDFIVAVGSVNPFTLQQFGKQMGFGDDVDELCNNENVKQMIIDELYAIGKEHERPGYEIIKKIHLYNQEFNTDNDLATPTLKLKRPQLLKCFKDDIDAMYEKIHEEGKNPKKETPKKGVKKPVRIKSQRGQKNKDDNKEEAKTRTSRLPKKRF